MNYQVLCRKSSWAETFYEILGLRCQYFLSYSFENLLSGGDFSSNLTIEKCRIPKIETAIHSRPYKISTFRKKHWHPCNWI